MSERKYDVQPSMFINPYSHAQRSVSTPDARLVETLHKALDIIADDNLALMIDHTVAQLLRVHVRPDGMFEPELLEAQL